MASDEFRVDLAELAALAAGRRVAVMCAEARCWRCHRQLIADAPVACQWEVRHILSATRAPAHTLTAFARLDGEQVRYPGLV